ncbi:hypothetical protein O181_025256 [Austropuccinia psidii MF-1]|uniref:Uncharacterized protein n=1 Tax=Austropuccinia psidii MF-1 TaxID=1389203 RepID=A0A9Q3CN23_9BASI|nr:hypothetical protein [Austropuccinia psidii MF-1]
MKFKSLNNKGKKKIFQSLQLSPEVNNGESGALSPSSRGHNDGPQTKTTSHHQKKSAKVGGVTDHHEKILQSKMFGIQEATNLPKENNSTET